MGMYTEIIFGASLKSDTPKVVIDTLKYMIGKTKDRPSDFAFPISRFDYMLRSASNYFGISEPVCKMWYDKISKNWIISTRSNIKNYCNEIEHFIEWIKPFVESGSGKRNMFAVVTYEEQEEPTFYYKD